MTVELLWFQVDWRGQVPEVCRLFAVISICSITVHRKLNGPADR